MRTYTSEVDQQIKEDRLREVDLLTRQGYTAAAIAVRIGRSSRTVERYRKRLQEQAGTATSTRAGG